MSTDDQSMKHHVRRADGGFVFPNLQEVTYSITVSAKGFQSALWIPWWSIPAA